MNYELNETQISNTITTNINRTIHRSQLFNNQMKKRNKVATRRDVIQKLLQGAGYLGLGGFTWGAYIDEAKSEPLILRPPGAIEEEKFLKACVKCGACVEACPYDTLSLAVPGDQKPVGMPFFEARKIACEMCPDIPCVPVCPSVALDLKSLLTYDKNRAKEVLDINKAKMGVAIVDHEACIAFWGIQCDICYRACPLMDKAIIQTYSKNERTGKHAFLRPEVDHSVCTGCGLCENACVTEQPAIRILPRSVATGVDGSHYIKSWDKNDEKRLKEKPEQEKKEKISDKALNYLNGDWEDL